MATGGSGGSTARFESGSSHANRGKPSGVAAQESSGVTVAMTATTMSQADLPMSSDGSGRSVTYGLKSDGSADRCLGRDGAAIGDFQRWRAADPAVVEPRRIQDKSWILPRLCNVGYYNDHDLRATSYDNGGIM
ncbi:Os11g0178100 [Oryza sativa Japonica Group]|uniref:Uncharacterized protein n=2 Tax=Oryza sativa subsp. japonica TaxID=39947 RepID=A3C973_ORYSJ|nr:hypothetical protein LOC_Os11g07630 [Oryza sativa Japonica Group]ABA91728.1 hypothetical protein LOC_Os11g07630 [Oryza sativa Japonica Group]EAZ17636.1 hypothetical protein OsJ_33171 [Oryza sativa Japonica Group]BAT12926.1 Os11g0178100 [Oryza sativa Japonica Group]